MGQTHVQDFQNSLTFALTFMVRPIAEPFYFMLSTFVVPTLLTVYETRADRQAVPVTLYTRVSMK